MHELLYWFVVYGGEEIQERPHLFSLFEQDCFETCEGVLPFFD
jgi:hypothetical protein